LIVRKIIKIYCH